MEMDTNDKGTQVRLGVVPLFSQYHIRSAVHQANLAYKIEVNITDDAENIPFYAHRSYVTSCVFLTVSFLEATINELIIRPTFDNNPWSPEQEKNYFQIIKKVGKIKGIKYLRTLDKYQLTLSILSLNEFNTDEIPYQNVDILIKFRNALIHYEPEPFLYLAPETTEEEHKLLRIAKGKFQMNPIADKMGRKNYPDILLGYGLAKWAVSSSINFVREYNSRLELIDNYSELAEKLQ